MNKSLIASSLLIPALLTGCGASSTSGTAAPKYKWQMVQLKSVPATSLEKGCVVYANSAANADEVITAYIAEQDYNILYHNADGSIFKAVEESEISKGALTIDSADVPDNGYVTVEEFINVSGLATASYMFSVQKALLSDMVININQEQSGDCYTLDDDIETADGTSFLDVKQPYGVSDAEYYQSSYDVNAVSGHIEDSYIPVIAPSSATRNILITAFNNYDADSNQHMDLVSWGFITPDYLYVDTESDSTLAASLSDQGLTDIAWSSNDSISLNSDSGVIAIHNGNSYFWQPIYANSADLSVAYETDQVTLWSSYFSGVGSQNDWAFTHINVLADFATDILLPEVTQLTSIDAVSIIDSCSTNVTTGVAAQLCIDTDASFSSASVDYQRTHLRLQEKVNTTMNYVVHQTTYSQANEEPIVLESELLELSEPTLLRTEFNLMSSDALDSSDAVQYLMTQNIDLANVGDYSESANNNAALTDFYSDIQGIVTSETEANRLYQAMLATTTTTLMNSYETTDN